MEDRQIIEMLMEGGNSVAVDRKKTTIWDRKNIVKKAEAQKIDMSKVSRSQLVKEFINTFEILNTTVKNKTGKPLWNNFNVVKSGIAFNGSSEAMFDRKKVADDEFAQVIEKQKNNKVGDIDITVPRDRMVDLFTVLLQHEDKKFGNIEYIGNNKKEASDAAQINAVFKYEVPGSDYVAFPQVDFEPSDYENDAPSQWDKFAHSSDWNDVKKGFKGVNHKYALTIVAHIVSKDFTKLPAFMVAPGADTKQFWETTGVVGTAISQFTSNEIKGLLKKDGYDEGELLKLLKTKNGRISKIRKQTKGTTVTAEHYLSFSVARGVRVKYARALTSDGHPIVIDGKMLLIDIDSKTASYETQLIQMFELFFGPNPSDVDLKKMGSFVGVIELLQNRLPGNKKLYQQFLDELIVEKLWGHPPLFYQRSQELDRDDPGEDAKIKWAMVNYIMKTLGVGNQKEIEKIAKSYYESWEGGSGDDIRENFIPFGSKFNKIFEAVSNVKKH
jgi:hypothetical protein